MGEKKLAEYILKQVQGRNLDKDTAIQFLKELQSKDREQDVAIIGMNCRLPDAEDLESFWANLEDGLSSIGDFPEMRKAKIAQYINQQYGQHSPDFLKGGFLSDIDLFDPQFFRISPAEAAHMDPMQRLFLETVYHSIEDAGYAGQNRLPENTGVYVGTDHTHKFKGAYLNLIPDPDFSDMIGSWTGLLASRISYFLNLKGPSIVLDTACSSGLVSIHTACRALQNKECAMAIAGGINLYLAPLNSGLEEIEAEAGSQIVRTFDKDANGMLWGEGVAAIVLKPLNQAVADGDHVYAVIKGSAVNNSGATNGISAPNADAQESVIVRAWENAGIDPQTITYIETFGTGTLVGDSIEVKGITQAFRRYTDAEKFCAIGSVKPNIGHTVAASGLCSVIKVALSLENKLLPPTIHYNEANPLIPFENSPVYVNAQRMPWVTTGEPRRAGVSAFGFSGTNGHLVLEEAPHCVPVQSDDFKILVLAAKKQSSMEELVSRYIRAVEDKRFPSLEELCFTANTGRTHFVEHRMAFVFKNAEELLIQLRKASYERPNSHMSTREGAEEAKRIIDRITSNGPGTEEQLKQLGMLYLNGVDISWTAFYSGRNYNRVSLPVYPYDRQSYWVDGTAELQAATTTAVNPKNRNALNASSVIHLQGRINEKYTDTEIEIVQVWGNVLGYSVLDVNANFFDLGGSSLQAMKIVNYINTRKRMSLTVPDLLSHPSITEFCVHLEAAQHAPATESALSLIRCIEPRDAYELSSSQKRIYVQQKLAENSLMYNLPVMSRVYGNLDIRRLEEAARLLIGRHESFRTHFDVRGNGDIIQKISNDTEPELAYFEADEKDLPLLTQQFVRPFDLHTDNLLRVGVVKYGEQKFILMLDTHHIISDGISIETMIRELISLYANRELPELPCQFKDFVEWQHETAITEAKMGTEQYWRDTLAGELPVLQLPLDDPRPSIQRFAGDRLTFELDEKTTAKLLELAKEEQTTSFTVFLTLFNVLLSRYSGQEDVIVGIPYSGRNLPGVDNVIGMFVNTVPVRSYPKGGKSFVEFLAEVKQATLQSYDNQNYPLEDIIELLSVQRDPSRNPLFDVMFVQQERINQSFDIEGVSFTPYELDNTTSKFDLTLQATPDRGRIKFELEYCTSLFRKETIQRMINHFIRMGQAVAADREIKLSEIPLLSEEESSLLLKWFNNTGISYTLDKPLHRLFEEQAHLREGQRAITSGNGQWTYGEINRRANCLARTLRGRGVKPGSIVGICVERSMEMMVGLLAVLKAGGA
ncbi:condensation domain-containing protein, partial [Paenibacillus graminis]|uniref:condensation domain-containing protein n=1 Tax=Paenibacillus graminis TaxID=189425 RepID=UPI002DB5EB16